MGVVMARIARKSPVVLIALMLLVGCGGCDRGRRDLLCNRDHAALLDAARTIWPLIEAGELELGVKYGAGWGSTQRQLSLLPSAIRDLKPSYVLVHADGYVKMEMRGGFDHFGLRAYREDFEEPHSDFHYGDRELIKGLWYYDEGYDDLHPEHKRKIDRWIEECKTQVPNQA